MDEGDPIAQRLDHVHLMRGEDGRETRGAALEDQVLDLPHAEGIEAGERLVEHAEGRLRHQGRRELDLLRHPFAEPLHLPPGGLLQPMRRSHASERREASARARPCSDPR